MRLYYFLFFAALFTYACIIDNVLLMIVSGFNFVFAGVLLVWCKIEIEDTEKIINDKKRG